MQVQKTWDSILNAPIALDDIVFAEMLWAAMKSLFSVRRDHGRASSLLGISRAPTMLLALPVLGLVGVTFASIALVFNALAKGYDFFTYYFTLVVTPMTFLSGVYFPIEQMPPLAAGGRPGAAADRGRRSGAPAGDRATWPADRLRPLADPGGVRVRRLLPRAGAHPPPFLR